MLGNVILTTGKDGSKRLNEGRLMLKDQVGNEQRLMTNLWTNKDCSARWRHTCYKRIDSSGG
jgi:hypothetical protein